MHSEREGKIMEEKRAWRLIFTEGLLENFLNFPNEVLDFRVSRESSNWFKRGQIIEGHFAEGFSILLEVQRDTLVLPLMEIGADIRNAWGRVLQETTLTGDVLKTMKLYYPEIDLRTEIAINWLAVPSLPSGKRVIAKLPPDALAILNRG